MSDGPKHMMEVMSEGYPTNACERAEQARQDAYVAERLREGRIDDFKRGVKVCRECRQRKRYTYRFPSAGCEHRRSYDWAIQRKQRYEQRLKKRTKGTT